MDLQKLLQTIQELSQVVSELQAKNADLPAALEEIRLKGIQEGKDSRNEEVSGLQSQIEQLKLDVQAAKDEGAAFGASEFARGKAEGDKEGYDRGFAAGVDSVKERIYTQEELDQKLSEAVAPLNERVAAMQTRIADLEAIVAGEAGRLAQAVEAMKADLLSKFDATQVDDAEFRKQLQPVVVETPVEEIPAEETPTEEAPVEAPTEGSGEEIPQEPTQE